MLQTPRTARPQAPWLAAPRCPRHMPQGRPAIRRLAPLAAVKVGDKAPDFSLPDQNGKTVKLSSYQVRTPCLVPCHQHGSHTC